jgi:hypothetical protein
MTNNTECRGRVFSYISGGPGFKSKHPLLPQSEPKPQDKLSENFSLTPH